MNTSLDLAALLAEAAGLRDALRLASEALEPTVARFVALEEELLGDVGVFLADPPWPYDQFRDTANGAAQAVMTTQPLKEILRLRAGHRWAGKSSVLILWGTGPKITAAVDTIRAWGFEHKAMVPWLKTAPKIGQLQRGGIGIWVQAKAEYVLFATRGKVGGFYNVKKRPDGSTEFTRCRPRPEGCLVGPREYPVFWDPEVNTDPDYWNSLTTQALLAPGVSKVKDEVHHSKKPIALYEFAESFPGRILELYARREPVVSFSAERRARYTCWGRQTGYDIGGRGVRPYFGKDEL